MTKKSKIKMISKNKRRKKYTKKRYMLYYIFFAIILVIVAAILCLTVFFNIEYIEIDNNSPYPTDAIIKASKIKEGDNLILTNTDVAEKNVLNSFINLDNITITKNFPDSIYFKCEAAVIDFCVQAKDKTYMFISKNKRILKVKNNQNPPQKKLTLKIEDENFERLKEGEFFKLPEKYEIIFKTIKNIIYEKNINNITLMEIKKNDKILLTFENRVCLKIDDISKADYLIDISSYIMKNIGANETGKIIYLPSKKTTHFVPTK